MMPNKAEDKKYLGICCGKKALSRNRLLVFTNHELKSEASWIHTKEIFANLMRNHARVIDSSGCC